MRPPSSSPVIRDVAALEHLIPTNILAFKKCEYQRVDVLVRFKLANPIDISLTGTEGTGQLKTLFATLLGVLIEENVEVAFSKTDGYSTKMYEDVCVEYVKVLNDELATARENAKKEGLAK